MQFRLRSRIPAAYTSSASKSPASSVLFLFILVILASITLISAADSDFDSNSSRCANSNQYQCPNCGGILVSDCLDCDGYLNTGEQWVDLIWFDLIWSIDWFVRSFNWLIDWVKLRSCLYFIRSLLYIQHTITDMHDTWHIHTTHTHTHTTFASILKSKMYMVIL